MSSDDAAPRVTGPDDLERLRERVLNVVGHALATPVATVAGLAEVLADDGLDPARRADVVAGLRRAASRLERLVDDLLVANDIDTRIPPEATAEVEVGPLVRHAWAEVDGVGAVTVHGDRTVVVPPRTFAWIVRVVLDNAARYGDAAPTVTVGARVGAGSEVVIASPGPELPAEDIANAFELFYRGHAAVMRVGARLGIGLTVARTLADRAGLGLRIDARDGGGVAVTIVVGP